MHNKILEIKNFSKTYPGGKRAVDGLSLDIFAGIYTGLSVRTGRGRLLPFALFREYCSLTKAKF